VLPDYFWKKTSYLETFTLGELEERCFMRSSFLSIAAARLGRAAEGRVPGGWRLKHALRFARERHDRRTTWQLPRKYPLLLKVK